MRRPMEIPYARNLFQSRGLLLEWTARTLRARYQQSLLGWLWAVIQPAAQALVFAVVFTLVVPVETGGIPYVVFVYVATVAWAFLATSLTDMADSLVANMNMVSKIYFPREVLPIAVMLARLLDLAIAAALFVGLALYYRVPALTPASAALPIVLLVQVALVVGIGLACAALNVFVRDVRSMLLLSLQIWFYASPVIYPMEAVPAAYRAYFALNPMAGIIEAYRAVLLRGEFPGPEFMIAAAASLMTLVAGCAVFKRSEYLFADVV